MSSFLRLLTVLCLGAIGLRAAEPEKPQPPQVIAPKATQPIVIDGFLIDTAWQQTPAMPVAYMDKKPGELQETGMSFKVTWDDQYLYIGYVVEGDPDLQALANEEEEQGPPNNRRRGVHANPAGPNDFVEFFISFGDRNFFWEIHHDPANNFNDVWCTVPEKEWPLKVSTMHRWGIHFAHREYIEDQGPYTVKMAVWTQLGGYRGATLNNPADQDRGWSGEIRLPWRGIGAPRTRESTLRPFADNPHFGVPGPWKMAGQQMHILAVLHRGELPERYYHSSPTRKGDWFHFTFDHWPVYTLTDEPVAAPAE